MTLRHRFTITPLARAVLAGLAVLAALTGITAPRLAACPVQTPSASLAVCGIEYGATLQYSYSNAAGWWFKERIQQGDPNTCQGGNIDQTTSPFQSSTGIVFDEVANTNGPPANVSPCRDVTNQTVYTGPTEVRVEECPFANGQQIEVTSDPKRVTTSSAGAAIFCTY